MSVLENPVQRKLESLAQAVRSWAETGDERRLKGWLGRELDIDGVPTRLAASEWPRCLEILAAARRQRGEWPSGCAEAITGLVQATLRFSRPDGSLAMQGNSDDGNSPVWDSPEWSRWYRGTGIAKVLGLWSGGRSRGSESAPPPLPTWSAPDRVLGMLRPDWTPGGDFVAIDHRDAGSPCRLELFGGGRPWLGPEWGEGVNNPGALPSRPRPARRVTGPAADLIEWTYRIGTVRITRSALLLRGKRLALLSVLVERSRTDADIAPTLRSSLPPNIGAGSLKGSRALTLARAGRRGAAQALPVALPCRSYPTDRGALRSEEGELILSQAFVGRRCWLPLLVSWDPERHRKSPDWRVLTVSEQSRPVPPDRAFAVRVSWGREETYVIYRSLGPPGRRAFLGHQTTARFLVAEFDEDGDFKAILTVE